MTIHLPNDVVRDILAEVHSGHFSSVDDALAEAWRSFRRQHPPTVPVPPDGQGLIGALRDDAELLDQITQDIMESRRTRKLRLAPDA